MLFYLLTGLLQDQANTIICIVAMARAVGMAIWDMKHGFAELLGDNVLP